MERRDLAAALQNCGYLFPKRCPPVVRAPQGKDHLPRLVARTRDAEGGHEAPDFDDRWTPDEEHGGR